MADDDYRPHSVNAMFARIEEHLKTQDDSASSYRTRVEQLLEGLVGEFRELTKRVVVIEAWKIEMDTEKKTQARFVIGVASVVSTVVGAAAWIIEHWRKAK